MIIWPAKKPAEVADYAFDWASVLEEGETIATKTVAADGVTVDSSAIDGEQVKAWLSAGTAGTVATVTCSITTSLGRSYSEVAILEIGGEPIDLAAAKASQRIDTNDEDSLLAIYLRAAVGAIERRIGKNLTPRVTVQTLAGFPAGDLPLRLFRGPVSEVVEVEYDDGDGVATVLSDYRLVEGPNAVLLPVFGESFPTTAIGPGTVRVTTIAGYSAAELPPELMQAVLLLFGHYNANREGQGGIPPMIDDMIRPFRSVWLA